MKTIVQLVLIDETGDSYYRMRWPGRSLCDQDNELCVINLDARAKERFSLALDADLLVLFQSNDLDMIEIINERRSLGKKTIVEYNDNFYAPPPCSPVFGPWSNPNLWQTYETIMNKGDHLIVTGEGLHSLLSKKVDCPVTILENHIYEYEKNFDDCWSTKEEFCIGWAGSVGHMSDLLAILPMLEEFCSSHKNAVLCLMGNESIPGYISLPADKFRFTPWGSMSEYYSFLRSIHVGVAPLASSAYNHCRSDIKAIEYASRGAIPIVQNLTPYKKLISAAQIPSFNSFQECYRILENAYSKKSSLREDAKKFYQYVMNHRLAVKNFERLSLYKSLINENRATQKSYSIGYHEVMGTLNTELACSKVVVSCQNLYKQKKFNECIALIKEHKHILEFEPTLVLILAEAIKHSDIEEACEILSDGAERFPLDLRFKLQLTRIHKTTTLKTAHWLHLSDFLERSEKHYIQFYEQLVSNSFIHDLKQYPMLLEIGFSLCKLYTGNFDLHMNVGEIAFKEKFYSQSARLLQNAYEIWKLQNIEALSQRYSNSDKVDSPEQYLLTLLEAAQYACTQ